jgi:DNA-directed RNA polymerase specialized sigma24 family protein
MDADPLPDLPDRSWDPHEQIADREEARLAVRELGELDPMYRDVLLGRIDDRTETELAAILGISVANVKIRTFRARRALRARLVARPPASSSHPSAG